MKNELILQGCVWGPVSEAIFCSTWTWREEPEPLHGLSRASFYQPRMTRAAGNRGAWTVCSLLIEILPKIFQIWYGGFLRYWQGRTKWDPWFLLFLNSKILGMWWKSRSLPWLGLLLTETRLNCTCVLPRKEPQIPDVFWVKSLSLDLPRLGAEETLSGTLSWESGACI